MGMNDVYLKLNDHLGFMMYLYYDPDENIFYDENYEVIENVFNMITPNDLYLYRRDPGQCIFPYKQNPEFLCEIIDLYS